MRQEDMKIVAQRQLAPDIFEMTITGEMVHEITEPGQFLNILIPQKDLVLRRPLGISSVDKGASSCQFIYRVSGAGTKVLASLATGDTLDVLGPLGQGFKLDGLTAANRVFIIGGGIGVPPLYELSRQLVNLGIEPQHFFGFTSKAVKYYENEFAALGEVKIATDDGSYGFKGNVGQLVALEPDSPTAVFACGNEGLLRAVETQFLGKVPNVQLSLEARMACGIGTCYACVCHLSDDPTGVKSVKICDDGPVFQAGQVVLP
ncbi:MAG: dihydroorotate dehydrogenase electron transfer subunit [Micrococcaceae bacterium]